MEQLKMYLMRGFTIPELELPEGYSISRYQTEADKQHWLDCCANGQLIDETIGMEAYDKAISQLPEIIPERDIFFLDYRGEHIATTTGFLEGDRGRIHMVGLKSEFRGKDLSKYVLYAALRNILELGDPACTYLTTDDFRLGAVKLYLNIGFQPVEYDVGMVERWEALMEILKVDRLDMLREDCTPFRTLVRNS